MKVSQKISSRYFVTYPIENPRSFKMNVKEISENIIIYKIRTKNQNNFNL